MPRGRWCLSALLLSMSLVRPAASEEPPSAEKPPVNRVWGVETSLVFPVKKIYGAKGSYQFWRLGEALAGFALQHWSDEDFHAFPPGQAEAYTLLLGYRQFLWRGLHVEVLEWPAYNRFHSHVDNKVYSGLELWMEMYAGYKLRFDVGSVDLFVTPQVGMGFGVAKQKKWPEENLKNAGLSFVPNLLVGVQF